MNSPKALPKHNCLTYVTNLAAGVEFKAGDVFYWSPMHNTVSYVPNEIKNNSGQWSLFHETSHALLGHQTYNTDFELLTLEVAAWKHASVLAQDFGNEIDTDYIEDCLDTYRDWLHQRSTCPTCGNAGLQHSPKHYQCHNCPAQWTVSESRFCRPYRRAQQISQTPSGSPKQKTTFL